VVTPEGFPIAYEVLAGNTADKTTCCYMSSLPETEDRVDDAQKLTARRRRCGEYRVRAGMRFAASSV